MRRLRCQSLTGHDPEMIHLLITATELKNLFKDSEPINIVCDSLSVTGIIERIEHSFLKEFSNKDLFVLLTTLYNLLLHRSHEYYILHLSSYTTLPRPIVE
ncbi:hypothetical protein Nmel_007775, partial [Mimus melanotis]